MDLDKVLLDPRKFYDKPSDVVVADDLSKSRKLAVLRRWESDAEQLLAAANEGMNGGEPAQLDAVIQAKRAVNELPA